MSRRFAATFIVLLSCPSACLAENQAAAGAAGATGQPALAPPAIVAPRSQSDYYERYDGAREAVHRNAEWKAEQRRQRIAAMQWMGYSPLRPPASPVPFTGNYSSCIGVGTYYRLPGTIYQPGLPTVVVGQADVVRDR